MTMQIDKETFYASLMMGSAIAMNICKPANFKEKAQIIANRLKEYCDKTWKNSIEKNLQKQQQQQQKGKSAANNPKRKTQPKKRK